MIDTTNQSDIDEDGVGDVCDPNPDDPDTEGELLVEAASSDVTIGGGGAGGPPDCSVLQDASAFPDLVQPAPDCWAQGSQASEEDEPTDGATGTPPDGPTDTVDGTDDGGSNAALIIGIFAGVIVAIGALGGGTAFIVRRGSGA